MVDYIVFPFLKKKKQPLRLELKRIAEIQDELRRLELIEYRKEMEAYLKQRKKKVNGL